MKCPECDADISIQDDAMSGEIVSCSECGADHEIIKNGSNVDLKKAETVGEDWGE